MRPRLLRTLSERPVAETNLSHYINRELTPVVRELARARSASPVQFAFASGAASLDAGGSDVFVSDTALTADSTLTLNNGVDGAQGAFFIQQDAIGGHALTVTAAGRTIVRADPDVDDDPVPAPDSITRYDYLFCTLVGVPTLILEKRALL